MDFAKLYDTVEYGQIAVIMQSDDDGGPEIRVFFSLVSLGTGVSSIAMKYEDTDDGWDSCEKAFNEKFSKEDCIGIVADISAKIFAQLTS